MNGVSMASQGFLTVRGRGYRPEQVDACTAALSRERDAAWERAARLTVLAKDMEAEVERLRETVAGLAPQTYETLGERACCVFRLALEEAADLRESARCATREELARAEEHALGVRRAAQDAADALRAEAEEHARRRLLDAQAEADDARVGARREVKERRSEALAALRDVRQRTAGMLAEQAKEHAVRWAEADQEDVELAAARESGDTEAVARAEAAVGAAQRELGEAREAARRCQDEAHARAAEIVAEARVREDWIARETERVLCEHSAAWADMQAQLDRVRNSLASLTGRTAWE
ncbi:cellulose-binding protein [Streptomyces shenzhenensis]|uniref:Cellulose-binding protein n=1 Tax=Streptomyces shenzhenensis TaxID=943815 RepID=A0A3M0I8B4_9ACTN|nr:cellulose-binding protein [Streptomyces shenzhenensis]RMB84578.1 cellulose-binding protein [Streptomyces shenzhenensis]